MKNSLQTPTGYPELLQDLKSRIQNAQVRAAFAVSREPLSRALLMEYRTKMDHLAPSTINVRMSAVRKLVGEARRNGMIGNEEATNLPDVPNVRQKGTRLGNWLTREQAKELLAVPDRSTLKGKRDYVIIALLVGCALRRRELASLNIEDIQLREGRWVIIDLVGKGERVRTVAVPIWVKQGVNAWMTAAKIEEGRLLRPLSKSGKILRDELGDWAIWSVVEQSSKQIEIEHFGAHDLRRTCAKRCRKSGGDLEQIKFLLGRSSAVQNIAPAEGTEVIARVRMFRVAGRHADFWIRTQRECAERTAFLYPFEREHSVVCRGSSAEQSAMGQENQRYGC